jgi:hypothetical protein
MILDILSAISITLVRRVSLPRFARATIGRVSAISVPLLQNQQGFSSYVKVFAAFTARMMGVPIMNPLFGRTK